MPKSSKASTKARRVLRFLRGDPHRRLKEIGPWVLLEEPGGATIPGHVTKEFEELRLSGRIEESAPGHWRVAAGWVPPDGRRCTERTVAGPRCRRWARHGLKTCAYHADQAAQVKREPRPKPRQLVQRDPEPVVWRPPMLPVLTASEPRHTRCRRCGSSQCPACAEIDRELDRAAAGMRSRLQPTW